MVTQFDNDVEIVVDFHDKAYGADWGENPDPTPEETEIARAAFHRVMEQPEKIHEKPLIFVMLLFAEKYFPAE